VADELAVKLVHLRRGVLRLDVLAELRLDHREHRLDVRPLVVVRQEVLALELEVVEHLGPKVVLASHRTGLERDVRDGSSIVSRLEVRPGGVRLVRAHLVHIEPSGRRVEQRLELRRVAGIGDDQVGHDVRERPTHRVRLDELRPLLVAPPLVVVVPLVDLGRESRGVGGELPLDALEGRGALLQHLAEQRRERRVVHVAKERVVVGLRQQESLLMAGVEGTRSPASALARVDLEHVAEHQVPERRLRAPHALLRNLDAVAEQPEHPDEVEVLRRLGLVVRRPVLRVLRGLVYHERPSRQHEPTAADLDGEDVLAERRPLLVVGAGAGRLGARVVHDPGAQAALRLDVPSLTAASLDLSLAGNLSSPVLPGLHRLPNYTPMRGTVKGVG